MKLYEIKGFDKGVKIRHKSWDKEEYIYFDSDFWLDKNGNHYDHYVAVFFNHTDWEVYEEPKVALPKLSSINGVKISETLAGKINISHFWQQSNLNKSIIELNNMLRANFGEVLKEIVTEPNPLGYEIELKTKEEVVEEIFRRLYDTKE